MTSLNDKTLGIVLSTIPINDHSQFVHIYTERYGRITCKVPLASRGRRGSQMRNLLSPMTLLDLVLTGRNNAAPATGSILLIKEASIVNSSLLIALTHPDKTALCLYMAELIDHTIREEERNANLWQFLTGSMEVLANLDEGWANFHLVFTNGLTRQLGFSIDTEAYHPGFLFDITEGIFTSGPFSHPFYLNAVSAEWYHKMLMLDYSTMTELTINRQQRAALLDMELTFLAHHIPEMGTLHCVDILKALFD